MTSIADNNCQVNVIMGVNNSTIHVDCSVNFKHLLHPVETQPYVFYISDDEVADLTISRPYSSLTYRALSPYRSTRSVLIVFAT